MEAEQIIEQMESLMAEAVELRHKVDLPKLTDQPSEIVERLQQARQAQDRLEEILRVAGRIKALTQRQKSAFEAVADDAWATSLSHIRQVPTFRSDYVGPREKYAEADLSTMTQRRDLRQAEDLLSHVTEAYDFIRTAYFGLNGVRDDIKDVLRIAASESRMER